MPILAAPRMPGNPFKDCAHNIYSQSGEDGIVGTILDRLPRDNWCVEFGAWDGVHLSNTYNLIANKDYKAVLIEADKKKFKRLSENMASHDVVLINKYVTFEGENRLDELLRETAIPLNFDFLSIDIDGCDYYIFESLKTYRPKLVCIEYNPSIPNEVSFVQSKDFKVKQGASAKAIVDLARQKRYTLVATTAFNLLLLDELLLPQLGLRDVPSLDQLRDDSDSKIYIFCGYDGTLITDKPVKLVWGGLAVKQDQLQALPKFLRQFPEERGFIRKIVYRGYLFFHDPMKLVRLLKRPFG